MPLASPIEAAAAASTAIGKAAAAVATLATGDLSSIKHLSKHDYSCCCHRLFSSSTSMASSAEEELSSSSSSRNICTVEASGES